MIICVRSWCVAVIRYEPEDIFSETVHFDNISSGNPSQRSVLWETLESSVVVVVAARRLSDSDLVCVLSARAYSDEHALTLRVQQGGCFGCVCASSWCAARVLIKGKQKEEK